MVAIDVTGSSFQHVFKIANCHKYCCEFSVISAVTYLSLVEFFRNVLKVQDSCPLPGAKQLLAIYPKRRPIVTARPR